MTTSTSSRRKNGRPAQTGHRCTECGWTSVKWVGRCGGCGAWGTVVELDGAPAGRTRPAGSVARPAQPIGTVDATAAEAASTGVGEFDRVLGGGLVKGAVALVTGEPGIGKSTLLLDVAARTARLGRRVLYVTGEESAAQVRLRAERIGAVADGLYLAAESDLGTVLAQIERVSPDLFVLDSVQTISSAEVDGAAGNVSQVREVAAAVIGVAKERDMSTLLVGHVTKDGGIAGPRVLEHLVDVVIGFEGDRHTRLRLVRAVKNRYGPTDEVGCFDLGEHGILGLADPSGLFLSSRDMEVPGTSVTLTLEGRRPLVCEVQSLMTRASAGSPRRTTSGLDHSRIAMVLAVLEKHVRMPVGECDCYVSTVGGVKLSEPASDLAAALAMASSLADRPLPRGTVVIGEVGLAGELRPTAGVARRLAEAGRLGFTRAVVPAGSVEAGDMPRGLQVHQVARLAEAVRGLIGSDR
ncbi:DNA repair protein RadA [Mobilicoccus sp.]|uniref:DNA repair protein RadA n=1 Tax=Mobilicoccus sp. TaxID=2034349 RepID=UPI0028ABF9CA|nr:DNA repair protein RadA [Mobilicoccus sp.]